mmetsp:Transcript_981/g.2158  ORF Transcript_981/g.2158 Transcript_981/m.2158 type:complete len:149 (-) Transcript_981:737-1183(-)|eukprot:CAMPEP_0201132538 /NCGR_PEP_ID=MMETSP0850-20130426/46077_1 /ASSEMBLY_ACC=CAM_ASM_000622 /TAXON_ID=183588 /ORGANISM="Pseudo-nitzschia fraudulenta, Strain WWA7" /LENGTH=148 /DNA_ID=CAMNT_0047402907 /DNA_START=440 /DNA_END=886 /DNA_ORIENTATION=-
MLSLHPCFSADAVVFASMMALILLASSSSSSSQSFGVMAIDTAEKIEPPILLPHSEILITDILTTADMELHRDLFDLASPFDLYNTECALSCNIQHEEEGDDNVPLINACPKVSEQANHRIRRPPSATAQRFDFTNPYSTSHRCLLII